MQALAAHEQRPPKGRRRWPWIAGAIVAVLVAAAGGYAFAVVGKHGGGNGGSGSLANCANGPTCRPATAASHAPLSLASADPSPNAQNVPSNTDVTLQFSQPLGPGGPTPSITPPVAGAWQRTGKTLAFTPSAPFIPYQQYKVTIPGGSGGLVGADGRGLATTISVTFTIADGSTVRLQQLLAQLGYLPVSYTEPPGVAPQDMAEPQAGTLPWRWPGTPTSLMDVWSPGQAGIVTKGAVMSFESQNGLTVDGIPGPQVWATLLSDVAANKASAVPYTYVLVSKTLPEHLTAWVNGAPQFSNIPVNTGVHGATTTDGTFTVFEHVKASTMIGTNVTGSHYDDPTVPWASYFNGGDALHGFVRAQYGFPQSNGCVEMRVTTAGRLWPDTGIGTLVTVVGPPA